MTHTTKHMPGPWVVHTFTISGKEKLEVLDATGTNACVQANAHLIAAAPAMYEALQQTLFLVELAALEEWGREVTGEHQPPTTEARDRLEKVKAALAQAEDKP